MSDGAPAAGSSAAAPAGRRVAWGLLDQVLASGSNFVVTILAARSLSASGFGGFALAMSVCIVTVFLVRGMASDPLSTAHASDEPARLRAAVRASGGTAVLLALVVAAGTAVAGVLIGGGLGRVLLALAVTLPGMALQDFVRYALIVDKRARDTFVNDLVWFVVQFPLIAVAIALDTGAAGLVLAWGIGGNLAAALGLLQLRTALGGPGQMRVWLRRHRDLWPFFVLDNLVYQATNLVLVVVISAVTSLAQVGGFRAAMTVYAPLAILGRGIVGVAVPELARHRDDPAAIRRGALKIAWLLTPPAVVWALLTLLIPDSAGRAFLGDSWRLAEPLLLLAGAPIVAAQFTVGTAVGIRALGAGREGLAARTLVSVVVLAAATVGAFVDGAWGVVVALAVTSPLQMLTWWWLLVHAARVRRSVAPPTMERTT